MIVFDLKCSQHHIFEGWFGSNQDFENQVERGLLSCPICGDIKVEKAVMAPLVGSKSNQKDDKQLSKIGQEQLSSPLAMKDSAEPDKQVADAALTNADIKQALTQLAKLQEKALQGSEWVGKHFVETARAMHYGEQEHKAIYGEASQQDAKDLLDEGIDVAPLPLPVKRPSEEH